MLHEKYIIRDAINRREFRKYAQKILRLIKNVEFSLSKNQLNVMFNDIDMKIRFSNIRRFKKNTTINNFLTDLNEFKHD